MLQLSLAMGPYDRTEALRDGRVRPEGIELTCLTLEPEETFWRQIAHAEFDVSEMSLSNFIVLRSQGDDRFVGIPVFPSRSFRHRNIFVRRASGIGRPEDLRGKRVGVPEYSMTAAVWVRGMLQEQYGVTPAEVIWVQGGQENPGRPEKVALPRLPELGIRLETAPQASLSQLLQAGEIDALITAKEPSAYRPGGPVVRLFEDFRAAEEAYFRDSGIFPIMHCVVVRRSIVQAHPWVPQSLMKAFGQAKALAHARLLEIGALAVMLPWLADEVRRLERLMGPDWWPYGMDANRATVERLMRYQAEQGLIAEPLPLEALFAPSTWTTFRI